MTSPGGAAAMLTGQARAELQCILARAKVSDSIGAAQRIEAQCAALLDRHPIDVRSQSRRAQVRDAVPTDLRALVRLSRGVEPNHRLHHFACWARYWLHREGLRLAVSQRSYMAQALQLLLDCASGTPRDASELLRTIRPQPLMPLPGVVRVTLRIASSN